MTAPNELDAIDAVFRGDREFLLRYELRHCDRSQLEELLVALSAIHNLFDEVTSLLGNLPRTPHSEPLDDAGLASAENVVAQEERRLDDSPP